MEKQNAWEKNLQIYYAKHVNLGRKQIFKVFFNLGVPKSSLNRWLSCLEKQMSLKRKVGSGRPTKIATRCNIAKIVRKFNHRSGCSQRKVARQLNTSHQYISYILKHRTEIRCRKKQKKTCNDNQAEEGSTPKMQKTCRDVCRIRICSR